jgi:hypothetical protein
MAEVFNKDYGELLRYVQQNNLHPLKFMAWYHTLQAPWPIDVAVATNQLPETLSGRIQSRAESGGAVLIAHIWGLMTR